MDFLATFSTIILKNYNIVNYKEAMNFLIYRFDTKVLHFQAIFGLKVVENGSSNGLCEFSDCNNSHLRAIRTLTTTHQILDGLLIHIVT